MVLMVPKGTEGGVWGFRKRLDGGREGSCKHIYGDRLIDNIIGKEEDR